MKKPWEDIKRIHKLEDDRNELLNFVQLVATGMRPDGTYNYCREALEQKAKEILKKY